MRRARAAVCLAAALMLAASTPPNLQGPLSDFWARVKLDWSRRIPGLNHGPLQTAAWVALIWDGPDTLQMDRLASLLQEREAKRWVRSQITCQKYSSIARRDLTRMQALQQHVILVGTPADNPLVARALERTPLKVGRGFVSVGGRRITGDGLLLFAVSPNPVEPGHYALVITGSSPSAILGAADVPYGESDFVVFRGRKTLDRGFFQWNAGAPDRETIRARQSFSDYFQWSRRESARFRIHFDPARTPPASVAELSHHLDDDAAKAAAFYGVKTQGLDRMDLYLYASVDEKVAQTSDARAAHYDQADDSLHVVWAGRPESMDAWDVSLAARALLRRAPGTWGGTALRELPGFAAGLGLASRDEFQTVPLAAWRVRSKRDTGFLPMDTLFVRKPGDPEAGDTAPLEIAGFLRGLILRDGIERMASFSRGADRSNFRDRFREVFGVSIAREESRWLEQPGVLLTRMPLETGIGPGTDLLGPALEAFQRRDDARALELLSSLDDRVAIATLRARLHFRGGRFAEAVKIAETTLLQEGGRLEDYAWARLTLGRARARLGLLAAARADLTASEIEQGPEQVRVIAALWLESLGQPLDQRAVQRMLMQEADTDLLNFDWDDAERKLKAVLAADPESREAHAALGQVYLSKYQYWYDWMLLDHELFPGESQADPEVYRFLADKGRRELSLAESAMFGQKERWMSETGPVEPGADQPMSHLLMGKASMLRGEYESARRQFQTALDLEPSSQTLRAFCHLYLARAATAAGDLEEARREYGLALGLAVGGEVTELAKEELSDLPTR